MAYNPNNANGQATMANSAPVVIASNQSAITVSQSTAANFNATVVNAGTFAVQAAQSGTWTVGSSTATGATIPANAFYIGGTDATNLVGAKMSAHGLNTVSGILAIGNTAEFDDVSPTTVTENQFGMLRISANRNLYSTIRDAAGNERGANVDASNRLSVTVDAFTATNASVNVAQINGVTPLMGAGNTGTGSPRVTLSTDQAAIATWGKAATGGAVPSGAQYEGFIATTANPSAASAGNLVGGMADKLGRQVVVLGNVRDLKGNQVTTITSSTSETTVVTAVASTFLDVYGCIVVNSSATAANVTFKDSTAGTTQFNVYVPAGETRGFMLPSSDGFKQTTVNNNWTATSSASVASLIITMLYVKNI